MVFLLHTFLCCIVKLYYIPSDEKNHLLVKPIQAVNRTRKRIKAGLTAAEIHEIAAMSVTIAVSQL